MPKNNQLDGEVYTRVIGTVLFDGIKHAFTFKIKNYHEIIRYNINLKKVGKKVWVEVVDADYQFKYDVFSQLLGSNDRERLL